MANVNIGSRVLRKSGGLKKKKKKKKKKGEKKKKKKKKKTAVKSLPLNQTVEKEEVYKVSIQSKFRGWYTV